MRTPWLSVALAALAITALSACAVEKQWMKVGEPYTTAEFRRDYAECSKKTGELDEDCLRARGWVDVKPTKADRAADAPPSPSSQNPRYRR
jgi:hypothetical protein